MKIWLLFIVFAGWAASAKSQDKWQFHSQNYIGLLEGDNGSSFQFTTVNGMQRGTWYAGLGTGLDWYRYRSVPLFLSINKDWKPSGRTFFFSLDAGTNFAWVDQADPRQFGYASSKFSPALYWGAGIGYKAYFKNKKDALILNFGYSYKRLKEVKEVIVYCLIPPCENQTEHYDYRMNRLSLRLGWQF